MEYITDPNVIERRSMELIAPYLAHLRLTPAESKVYARIIHAAGDPDYANHIVIHPEAVAAGCAALKQGAKIFTDVQMVRVGINAARLSRFGGETLCGISDPAVVALARETGLTRAMVAMRRFGRALDGNIVAVGNAPTALFAVLELLAAGIRPALVIGVPVGFVGAAESKAALAEQTAVPFITVQGNKGGSTIAAAIANALLYMVD